MSNVTLVRHVEFYSESRPWFRVKESRPVGVPVAELGQFSSQGSWGYAAPGLARGAKQENQVVAFRLGVTFDLSGRVRPGLSSWSAVRTAVCGRGQEPPAGTGRVQE